MNKRNGYGRDASRGIRLTGSGKPDLANRLWPLLEARVKATVSGQAEDEIPVVRIVYAAEATAYECGRGNTLIGLTRR